MLMAASMGGLLPIVERVLPQSDVNAAVLPTHTEVGHTALMYACMKGHEQIANVLLVAGANKDATTPDGTTAYSLAGRNGHTAVSALLA